jgi:MFS family permease
MNKPGFVSSTRLLFGISLFWMALSILLDGINTLVLPQRLLSSMGADGSATTLGLLSFIGLLAGMLVMPIAGAWSDRLRARVGRVGMIGLGTFLTLIALSVFGMAPGIVGLALGYLFIQVAASIAQAAQQGFIPDLVPPGSRGKASGLKSFMDIGGAMLGFVLLGQLLGSGNEALALTAIGALLLLAFVLTALLVREHPLLVNTAYVRNPFQIDLRRQGSFAWLVFSRFFFLLGTYAIGRFLLFFVAARLGLDPQQAAEQAGSLLAGLALVTILAAPLAGWLVDRLGRKPMMLFGALVSAGGALLLIWAANAWQILLFGSLLSLGSAAFVSANWAMTADVVPKEEAGRFFGLANFGTAGAAAAAGLFGPLVDAFNLTSPGTGYVALFMSAALAFLVSAFSLQAVRSLEISPPRERPSFLAARPSLEKN